MARTANSPASSGKERTRGPAHEKREAEARVYEDVHDEEDAPWIRGASLAAPPPRKGMDQRWIRFAIRGNSDATNWSRKMREGWKPRAADTVPASFAMPTIDHGQFKGLIGVEGSVLCERPMSMSKRREKHFADVTQKRTDAINSDLQKLNEQNANPAFGPVRMASRQVPMREVAREVAAQDD